MSKKKTSKGQELDITNDSPLAFLPDDVDLIDGGGLEGADKDSFAIPFLRVLQKMSPQVDEADASYIEGAKPGMIFDTVTEELYDGKEGVLFIPCAFQRRFLRWAPRNESEGMKGEVMPEDIDQLLKDGEIVQEDGRYFYPREGVANPDKTKNDHLADTRTHFGILIRPDGRLSRVVLSLSSTQIKKSKRLISLLSELRIQHNGKSVTPPTWASIVRITTALESNDEGSWHGVNFRHEGFVDSPETYAAGEAFSKQVMKGEAKPTYDDGEAGAKESEGATPPGKF